MEYDHYLLAVFKEHIVVKAGDVGDDMFSLSFSEDSQQHRRWNTRPPSALEERLGILQLLEPNADVIIPGVGRRVYKWLYVVHIPKGTRIEDDPRGKGKTTRFVPVKPTKSVLDFSQYGWLWK